MNMGLRHRFMNIHMHTMTGGQDVGMVGGGAEETEKTAYWD